ncbi:unnamed protein product [Scytosiphon promiscuus]
MLWVTETDLGGGIQRTLLQKRVGEFDGREGQDAIPHWVMACVLHGEFHTKEQPKVSFRLAPWMPPKRNSFPLPSLQQQGKKGGGIGAGGDAGRPVSFREPRGGGAGGAAAGGGGVPPSQVSQSFTAPAQMLVSKVMAYVLSHEDLRRHLESTVEENPAAGETGADFTSREGAGGGRGAGRVGGLPGSSREAPEDLVEVLCGDRVVEPHLYIGAIQQHIWNSKAAEPLFLHYRSRRQAALKR